MNRRPIVTYAGDNSLFSGLQAGLVTGLPQESVEWRRSYGRPSRCVHVEVDFVPFSEEILVKETPRSILGQPIFHTYWTDCSDVEAYKNTTRESLQSWALALKQHGISDWMVVLLETPDTRKANKLLPRTTVLDKIKSDFGSKQPERCVAFVDPLKTDSRSLESWQTLLTKMRHLIMVAYNRALNRFEEGMRAERERRTEKSWSFCWYFLLQEELAHVFQLLALYDESLVQYDELDALFTQFVVNSAAGDSPSWLSTFSQACERWEGLHITPEIDLAVQAKIRSKEVTLLEFRNYLFQRQCALLMHLNKPWEVASRALTFLQNTVGELNIMEVSVAPGGVACWGLLSCLEVTDALHRYHTTDAHALHTAPLWAYARDKLQELGGLCGLMPGSGTNSAQLHTVISLVYGMGNDPHSNDESSRESPMTRLKDSLSSPQAFKKYFLELSEVAISTYKHIGRIRSARLIGRDLAQFYMTEGESQKAVSFLTDQLTVFLEEGWQLLATQTQLLLADCYLAIKDLEKYVRTCAHLASSSVLQDELRDHHFTKIMDAVVGSKEGLPVLIPSEHIFEVGSLNLVSEGHIILGAEIEVEVSVFSKLPQDICCTSVCVSLHHWDDENEYNIGRNFTESDTKKSCTVHQGGTKAHNAAVPHSSGSNTVDTEHSTSSTGSFVSTSTTSSNSTSSRSANNSVSLEISEAELSRFNLMTQLLPMTLHLEYKQDKSLSSASVTCPNSHKVLRRRDSQGRLYKLDRSIVKEDQRDCISAKEVIIRPGPNTIILHTKVEKKGKYSAGQVVLALEQIEFVCGRSSVGGPPLTLEVVSETPRVCLGKGSKDLLAGLIQEMILTVHSGSSSIKKGTVVKLRSTRGLTMSKQKEEEDPLERELEIQLPEIPPFSSVNNSLKILAKLGSQRDASTIEHMVSISSTLIEHRQDIEVHFIPPFMSSYKLHTANTSKFLQMTVTGLVSHPMELTQSTLKVLDAQQDQEVQLKPLHPTSQTLVVCSDQAATYIWEVGVNYQDEGTSVFKLEFSVAYQPQETLDGGFSNPPRIYTSTFDLHDYKTLYSIQARVEPSKGSELCRAGNMCHLNIVLQQEGFNIPHPVSRLEHGNSSHQHSIMYEVLTDQSMWAVCGRTAGVLTLEGAVRQSVTMDVMPLAGGFLPLPSVRLSKYIPADTKHTASKDGAKKMEHVGIASSVPRLQPFSPGQVYNFSKAQQVHVLPASNTFQTDSQS